MSDPGSPSWPRGRAIALADVLRAFRGLGATTDDERAAIARLLGFALLPAEPAAAAEPEPEPEPEPGSEPVPGSQPEPVPVPVPGPAPDAAATEVVRLPDITYNPIDLPDPLPRPAAATPAVLPPSLFRPDWSPAILARLGSRLAPAGALDVARLVARVARRAAIRELPRRLRLATAPAIAVVLDESGVMPWLAGDQAALVARLRAGLRVPVDVVGSDGPPAVTEPGAGAPPGAAGAVDDDERAPAVRASHGTRVLAVTDLGAGSDWSPASPDVAAAWRRFAHLLHAHGASLVVLTPIPLAQLPAALASLCCVHWDRDTRPSQVHALVKALR